MKWYTRFGASLAVCWAVVAAATGAAPPARPPAKPKVEFRWLERKPIKGVTEDKGFRFGCDPEDIFYPHKTPVLTGDAVAGTSVRTRDFGANSGFKPRYHYSVNFELTAAAKAKLAAAVGPGGTGLLGVYVDGSCWTMEHYQERMKATFEPSAGLFDSREPVDRITGAFK